MATTKKAENQSQETKVQEEPQATPPEKDVVQGYTLTHSGHGRYKIEGQDGKEFASRQRAIAYIADLKATKEFEEEFGDKVPEGIEVHSRPLEYRGTLLELPMNELYTPDGDHNPYYDREWAWGWGRAMGDDVAKKQSRGYRIVDRDTLEQAVEDGKVPEHYRSLLLAVEHGSRMQYGDLVLMRQPRVLWRQHRAKKEEQAMARIRKTDEEQHAAYDRAGVKNVSGPIQNEITTGLKTSGF